MYMHQGRFPDCCTRCSCRTFRSQRRPSGEKEKTAPLVNTRVPCPQTIIASLSMLEPRIVRKHLGGSTGHAAWRRGSSHMSARSVVVPADCCVAHSDVSLIPSFLFFSAQSSPFIIVRAAAVARQVGRNTYGDGEGDTNAPKAWEERGLKRAELFEKGQSRRIWAELYKVGTTEGGADVNTWLVRGGGGS